MKNKKWLKEQLSYLQEGVGESFNDYSKGLNAAYNTIELLINKLEEPEQEKVVVPQFVADWIEKEKLYKVELPIDRLHHILTIHADSSGHFFGKEHTNNSWYRTHLTEQEIKAIDERFWAFAEEITK